jgi:hypothetical protein
MSQLPELAGQPVGMGVAAEREPDIRRLKAMTEELVPAVTRVGAAVERLKRALPLPVPR